MFSLITRRSRWWLVRLRSIGSWSGADVRPAAHDARVCRQHPRWRCSSRPSPTASCLAFRVLRRSCRRSPAAVLAHGAIFVGLAPSESRLLASSRPGSAHSLSSFIFLCRSVCLHQAPSRARWSRMLPRSACRASRRLQVFWVVGPRQRVEQHARRAPPAHQAVDAPRARRCLEAHFGIATFRYVGGARGDHRRSADGALRGLGGCWSGCRCRALTSLSSVVTQGSAGHSVTLTVHDGLTPLMRSVRSADAVGAGSLRFVMPVGSCSRACSLWILARQTDWSVSWAAAPLRVALQAMVSCSSDWKIRLPSAVLLTCCCSSGGIP